jgi:WD40 repeat protein
MARRGPRSRLAITAFGSAGAFVVGASLVGCGAGTPGLAFRNRLFAVNRDGSGLRVISAKQRGSLFSPPSHPGRVKRTAHGIAWSAPGSHAQHRLGGLLGARYVSWSPDSRELLIGAVRIVGDRRFHLFTVSAAGGRLREITGGVQEGSRPAAWSPDGKWIAAASYDGDIEVVRPGGSAKRTLVHVSGGTAPTSNLPLCVLGATCSNSVQIQDLAWSADGRRLTFVASKTPPET